MHLRRTDRLLAISADCECPVLACEEDYHLALPSGYELQFPRLAGFHGSTLCMVSWLREVIISSSTDKFVQVEVPARI